MKKLATLLLAAGLIFSAAQPAAHAAEVKVSGMFDFAFEYTSNLGNANMMYPFMDTADAEKLGRSYHQKRSAAVQRLLIGIEFIASENLSAYWDGMFGYNTWGGPASGIAYPANANGGALGSRAANIITRQAYLDWVIPETDIKIRMGQQFFYAPSFAAGNPALVSETGTGITVTGPINDQITFLGQWIRVSSEARRGASAFKFMNDTLDVFALMLPLRYESFRLTPWMGYARAGNGAIAYGHAPGLDGFTPVSGNMLPLQNAVIAALGKSPVVSANPLNDMTVNNATANSGLQNANMWWVGFGGELTRFDPFRLAIDTYYGNNGQSGPYKRSGWYASMAASYKTQYGIPTLKAWYATGDDGEINNGSERPVVLHGGFAAQGADTFFTTSIGTLEKTLSNGNPSGTWGVSAQWNGLSLIPEMMHNFHVTYFQGTNNKNMARYADPTTIQTYITKADSAVEIDFYTTYNIYRDLTAMLQLSYIIQNFDEKLWTEACAPTGREVRFSDAYRVSLMLRYRF